MRHIELKDITLDELEAFVASLTCEERRYYPVPLRDILAYSIYIRGYWDGSKLIGLGGATWRYLIAFGQYPIVKREYWGKGWGTKILNDAIMWLREKHAPYTLFQYETLNIASYRMHEKLGYADSYRIGKWTYNFVPFCYWAKVLRLPVMGLIWVFHITHKRQ